jgi:hypothetical protein
MTIFATRTDLMAHQEAAVAKLLPSRVGALLMEMGTGKSRAVIELARVRAAKWDRFIWFCPVSLKETVLYEILKHTDLDESQVCVFGGKTSAATVPMDRIFYVVGIESMASGNRVVLAVNKIVTRESFVVVDESSYIKSPWALRTQRITGICARAKYRAILTGTPFTQGVVDLYSQMKFLSPKILGYNSFWSFANNHLQYEVKPDAWGREKSTGRIIHSHNHDYLAGKIAPYVYQIRKSECLTLPDKVYETVAFAMSPVQRGWHEEAKSFYLLERNLDDWTALWIFRLFTALQTIACGFWTRDNPDTGVRETVLIKHRRLEMLHATIAEIPGDEKIIVWSKYRRCMDDICGALSAEHGADQVCRYDGTLSEKQRGAELARWRQDARFFVATQSTGGHGLSLNESNHAIFYANGFKYSERIQSEDRIHRIGQAVSPTYVTIHASGSIDDRITAALDKKGDALRSFQAEVQAVRSQGLRESALKLVRAL